MIKFLIDLKEGILISLRAIRANKVRSVLTTVGIIIGIFAVTVMSTAIVGLREAFVDSISSLGSDVLYVDKMPWFAGQNWESYRNRKDITYEQYEKLSMLLSEYEAMAPNKRSFGRTIKYEDRTAETTLVYGTTEDFEYTANILPEVGRFMNELEVRAGRNVIIIGQDIADILFPNFDYEQVLGKEVKLNGRNFNIIGILEKQGSGFLGSFSLDGQVIMPLKAFEKAINSRWSMLRIDVKVGNTENIEDRKEEIQAAMRTIRKVPLGEPDDFAINQQEQFQDIYNDVVGPLEIGGYFITALSLFVGAIGIMNIMFVSVTERTKEIGIRKAIGAKTYSILTQFLAEAAFICLIGGIIGIVFAYPVSLIIDSFLPTSMPLDIVIIALVISAAVGIISGFLPAFKASKMDPVDALRYE